MEEKAGSQDEKEPTKSKVRSKLLMQFRTYYKTKLFVLIHVRVSMISSKTIGFNFKSFFSLTSIILHKHVM